MTTATYCIEARNGLTNQADEEYRLVGPEGVELDWGPAFSSYAARYEELTGESIDGASHSIIPHGTLDETIEYTRGELVAGDMQEGIAVLDGRAYEIWRGEAIPCREGKSWESPSGDRYEVAQDGDGTCWAESE
jgi:hypothetical protein